MLIFLRIDTFLCVVLLLGGCVSEVLGYETDYKINKKISENFDNSIHHQNQLVNNKNVIRKKTIQIPSSIVQDQIRKFRVIKQFNLSTNGKKIIQIQSLQQASNLTTQLGVVTVDNNQQIELNLYSGQQFQHLDSTIPSPQNSTPLFFSDQVGFLSNQKIQLFNYNQNAIPYNFTQQTIGKPLINSKYLLATKKSLCPQLIKLDLTKMQFEEIIIETQNCFQDFYDAFLIEINSIHSIKQSSHIVFAIGNKLYLLDEKTLKVQQKIDLKYRDLQQMFLTTDLDTYTDQQTNQSTIIVSSKSISATYYIVLLSHDFTVQQQTQENSYQNLNSYLYPYSYLYSSTPSLFTALTSSTSMVSFSKQFESGPQNYVLKHWQHLDDLLLYTDFTNQDQYLYDRSVLAISKDETWFVSYQKGQSTFKYYKIDTSSPSFTITKQQQIPWSQTPNISIIKAQLTYDQNFLIAISDNNQIGIVNRKQQSLLKLNLSNLQQGLIIKDFISFGQGIDCFLILLKNPNNLTQYVITGRKLSNPQQTVLNAHSDLLSQVSQLKFVSHSAWYPNFYVLYTKIKPDTTQQVVIQPFIIGKLNEENYTIQPKSPSYTLDNFQFEYIWTMPGFIVNSLGSKVYVRNYNDLKAQPILTSDIKLIIDQTVMVRASNNKIIFLEYQSQVISLDLTSQNMYFWSVTSFERFYFQFNAFGSHYQCMFLPSHNMLYFYSADQPTLINPYKAVYKIDSLPVRQKRQIYGAQYRINLINYVKSSKKPCSYIFSKEYLSSTFQRFSNCPPYTVTQSYTINNSRVDRMIISSDESHLILHYYDGSIQIRAMDNLYDVKFKYFVSSLQGFVYADISALNKHLIIMTRDSILIKPFQTQEEIDNYPQIKQFKDFDISQGSKCIAIAGINKNKENSSIVYIKPLINNNFSKNYNQNNQIIDSSSSNMPVMYAKQIQGSIQLIKVDQTCQRFVISKFTIANSYLIEIYDTKIELPIQKQIFQSKIQKISIRPNSTVFVQSNQTITIIKIPQNQQYQQQTIRNQLFIFKDRPTVAVISKSNWKISPSGEYLAHLFNQTTLQIILTSSYTVLQPLFTLPSSSQNYNISDFTFTSNNNLIVSTSSSLFFNLTMDVCPQNSLNQNGFCKCKSGFIQLRDSKNQLTLGCLGAICLQGQYQLFYRCQQCSFICKSCQEGGIKCQTFSLWFWLIISTLAVILIGITILIVFKLKKRRNTQRQNIKTTQNDNEQQSEQQVSKSNLTKDLLSSSQKIKQNSHHNQN